MNYWIFVANYWKLSDGRWVDSRKNVRARAEAKLWGLGERSPNRKALAQGDRIVFYAGGGESQVFMGTATLASGSRPLSPRDKQLLAHTDATAQHVVDLDEVELWPVSKPARDLVPHLSFIHNKEYWGTYLQGGVRSISPADYIVVTEGATTDVVQQITRQSDLESASEFALEQHLEEFIEANWLAIFGGSLLLYQVEGQTGRQYPAGPPGTNWSIDFLAVDRDSSDLVVIELKRGKSSDSVVGQLLRYMAWVKENVASGEQAVRGMVIAKEVDDALAYAVRDQPISVKTYEVSFRLKD